MVSLSRRRDIAQLVAAGQDLHAFQRLLEGRRVDEQDLNMSGIREQLLVSISAQDASRFSKVAMEVGKRKISNDSDWCQDDYLVFLLILGNDLFDRPLTFLRSLLEVRRANPNPIAYGINEVFSALEREAYGIEGEYCFLKIPFLHLTGKLKLGVAEARRALQALSAGSAFEHMSPFMQLLALKAHDIILTERQPLVAETVSQVIEALEANAGQLTIGQWWRVVFALPGRLWLGVVGSVVGLGLIPVLFGMGSSLMGQVPPRFPREIPHSIHVATVRGLGPEFPQQIRFLLSGSPPASVASDGKPVAVALAIAPFQRPTRPFVVEISHQDKQIEKALAFTAVGPLSAATPFTVVPMQRDSGRFRALLPEQEKGAQLYIVLELVVASNQSAQVLARQLVLRPLP
jgi:hypothetical protein